MSTPPPEEEALVAVLGSIRDARQALHRLVQEKDRRLRDLHRATRAPKTGPNCLGVMVRSALAARGWEPGDIDCVGVSDQSCRAAVERVG